MDEQTRAMVLESLLRRWATTARCLRGIPEGVEDRAILLHAWRAQTALRSRCGWADETPRPWTAEDTYRARVELSRLRLDLEGEWTPPPDEPDAGTARPERVAARACALTGVLLGWPDGTLAPSPPPEVWDLLVESMEVLNRASAECTAEIGESLAVLDRARASHALGEGPEEEWATPHEGWEFSLGPGA